MMKFIKKHRICFSLFALLLIPFSIWLYREYRDQVDRGDSRLFPIPMLSEPSRTIIEYKTGSYIRYSRCFKLAFKFEAVMDRFNNHLIFDERYNFNIDTEQTFYLKAKDKPHFIIKIYKDSVLLEKKELHIMFVESMFFEDINGKSIELSSLFGFWGPSKAACYDFEANATYTIEMINDTPLPTFTNLDVFLIIRPDRIPRQIW